MSDSLDKSPKSVVQRSSCASSSTCYVQQNHQYHYLCWWQSGQTIHQTKMRWTMFRVRINTNYTEWVSGIWRAGGGPLGDGVLHLCGVSCAVSWFLLLVGLTWLGMCADVLSRCKECVLCIKYIYRSSCEWMAKLAPLLLREGLTSPSDLYACCEFGHACKWIFV